MISRHKKEAGFALPSIIISALVMFTIVVTLVGSVSSVKVALDTQYYRSLARDAAESGANYAKVCLYEPTFVQGDSIDPTKTCKKTASGMSQYLIDNSTGIGSAKFRTTYSANLLSATNDGKRLAVTGKVQLLRTTNNTVWREYTWVTNVQMTKKIDPEGDRASKRWWYFGRFVSMDFGRSGVNNPVVAGMPYGGAPGTPGSGGASEGATVTTDQNGNLQFWSNGLHIWNRDNEPMSDVTGSSTPLFGNHSATQGGVSFPLNSARTKYGVVANTGSVEVEPGELYLHTIDMTLNGGKGAITSKNKPLSQKGQIDYTTEAVTAMPNSDGSGYYVYTFQSGANAKMMRFYIGMDGKIVGGDEIAFNPMPVPCTIAGGQSGFSTANFNESYTLLAISVGAGNCNGPNQGRVYLYAPNRDNGSLTLLATWQIENDFDFATEATGGSGSGSVYSAAFSPGDRYLYVYSKYPGRLTRYSLGTKTSAAIKASEWAIPKKLTNVTNTNASPVDEAAGGHIMTAPNNKIYMADRAYEYPYSNGTARPCTISRAISYIGNPNAETKTVEAIDIRIDAISLPAGGSPCYSSSFSLPQMVTVYMPEIIIY